MNGWTVKVNTNAKITHSPPPPPPPANSRKVFSVFAKSLHLTNYGKLDMESHSRTKQHFPNIEYRENMQKYCFMRAGWDVRFFDPAVFLNFCVHIRRFEGIAYSDCAILKQTFRAPIFQDSKTLQNHNKLFYYLKSGNSCSGIHFHRSDVHLWPFPC